MGITRGGFKEALNRLWHHKGRLSLQGKVLLICLGFLLLMPAAIVGIVDLQSRQSMEADVRALLDDAEKEFRQSYKTKLGNFRARYISRYSSAADLEHLKETVAAGDAEKIQNHLISLLGQFGSDARVILFQSPNGTVLGEQRGGDSLSIPGFSALVRPLMETALKGEQATDMIALNERAYSVVAMPVPLGENTRSPGGLVVGFRVGKSALDELRGASHAELLLVVGNRVTASTISGLKKFESQLYSGNEAFKQAGPRVVDINGQRYLASVVVATDLNSPAAYMLLISFEQQLRALAKVRETMLVVTVAGILMSGLLVWFFVSKITRPLRDLREGVEAVARGDFSGHIEVPSDDECGKLAESFNHMTTSLQQSHAELAKTVETLKTTQAQLIQSEKLSAVGQFVAGVAHELNNPLTAVIGFTELVREQQRGRDLDPQLDVVIKSALRCHKIVQNLLSFSRQQPPSRQPVDVATLINDLLEIMAYDLRKSRVTVSQTLPADLPLVFGDPHQLQQVFVNILGNARQALHELPRQGKIDINAFCDGRTLRLEFRDNGPGIKPEHLPRIFDPFFTTKPVGEGTGLGLSLAYGIIEEHGGKIHVRSQPDHGAVFIIELPVASAEQLSGPVPGEAKVVDIATGSRPPFSGKTVLVVDDEEWILALVNEILQRDGHAVETASSGKKAVELASSQAFDAIVTDWKMNDMTGIEFYQELKKIDEKMAAHVLFITGDILSEGFQDFLQSNGRRCLPKPFPIGEFREAVSELLAV